VRGGFYGRLASVIRSLVRVSIGRYEVTARGDPPVPSVYVVHHRNMHGPLTSIAWLDTQCHLWALSVFFTRKGCFDQYVDYTFTRRFRMPRFLAVAIAAPVSFFVSGLMNSLKAIPVHRGSTKIVSTMRQTVAALKAGESVLISPDVDYTDTGSGIGVMHEGFLHIEKFFSGETGAHVDFVPVHIDRPHRAIYLGDAIRFHGRESFRIEKDEVYARIKREFSTLEQLGAMAGGTA
jgi:1-acyl-sn-glycerol-3-phosphate acyltransferase